MKIKHISAICFIVAFIMALVFFAGVGRTLISSLNAKYIFIVSGAVGMMLNLIVYRTGKDKAAFNFWFWLGSIVVLIGLLFKLSHWPFSFVFIIVGAVLLGVSFYYSPMIDSEEKNDDLLDDPEL